MASGCLVIGSRTGPVEEVIADGVNGVLVDFFDTGSLADRLIESLQRDKALQPLRRSARQTVIDRYSLRDGERRFRALLPALG